jgi:hypothetical protein
MQMHNNLVGAWNMEYHMPCTPSGSAMEIDRNLAPLPTFGALILRKIIVLSADEVSPTMRFNPASKQSPDFGRNSSSPNKSKINSSDVLAGVSGSKI